MKNQKMGWLWMNQDDKNESIATEIIREQKQKIKLYKLLCSIQAIIIIVGMFIYLKGGI